MPENYIEKAANEVEPVKEEKEVVGLRAGSHPQRREGAPEPSRHLSLMIRRGVSPLLRSPWPPRPFGAPLGILCVTTRQLTT